MNTENTFFFNDKSTSGGKITNQLVFQTRTHRHNSQLLLHIKSLLRN